MNNVLVVCQIHNYVCKPLFINGCATDSYESCPTCATFEMAQMQQEIKELKEEIEKLKKND